MKKIILTLLALWFTYILFMLCIEETNAYEVSEYKWITVTHDKGACGYRACYFHSGYSDIERRNTINIESYAHEREYKSHLYHEYGHHFFSNVITQEERDVWNALSRGDYDEWLVNNGIDIRPVYISDYISDMIEQGKYDEEFAEIYSRIEQTGNASDKKSKYWLKTQYIQYLMNKY